MEYGMSSYGFVIVTNSASCMKLSLTGPKFVMPTTTATESALPFYFVQILATMVFRFKRSIEFARVHSLKHSKKF